MSSYLTLRDVSVIADYFVICSGNNSRQLQAIADAIDEELGKQGAFLLHREGLMLVGYSWILETSLSTSLAHKKGNIIALNASGVKQKPLFTCSNQLREKVTMMTFFATACSCKELPLGACLVLLLALLSLSLSVRAV